MDWWTLATVFALGAIMLLTVGAAVGLGGLLSLRPAIVVVALVGVAVAIVAIGTAWSRERPGTTYW